ncbi:MAG: acetyl-CoA carboxylase biotin carboxyl carrier protein [Clostridium sp.]|nr:acetyl-CoA carboxylase biotin carboxyl carrier protein [Clostridium sp.]
MEWEQLLQLIEAVSESKLTDFRYEENGVKLCLKKEDAAVRVQAAGMPGMVPPMGGAAGMPGAMPPMAGTAGMPQMVPPMAGAAGIAGAMPPMAGVAGMTGMPAASATGQPESVQAASGTEDAAPVSGNIVKSPLVGVFYAAPSEDAKPYVSVGDPVKKGQVLACVEAMKLMNEIESEYDGVVAEILVESGQGVGYGEPLFVIR